MRKISLFRMPQEQIQIRKRSFLSWAVLLIALWSFLIKPLGLLPGPLGYTKYIADGILLGLFVLTFCRSSISIRRSLLPFVLLVGTLLGYLLVVYLFQYQSVFYFLWGFRNNFRFFIAFFAFIVFLDETDAKTWFRLLDILFWINAVLSVIQFLILDVRGDFLGGIFGIEGSSNAFTMVFSIIVVGRTVLAAFNGQVKMSKAVWFSVASLLVAVLAEIKVYFIIYILILGMAAAFTRFSFRKLIIIMVGAAAIIFSSRILVSLFEYDASMTLDYFIDLATKETYSSGDDINRLSAISTLSQTVVTNPLDQFFGLGLGNCDTSAFAICNTPFYQRYGHLHYTWFTAPMIFLEMGYIGLGLYILFFVMCVLLIWRKLKAGVGNKLNCQLALMMAVLCIILVFYNSSLRIESAYMIYFVLALPFVRSEEEISAAA